jgi:hypothetical protein
MRRLVAGLAVATLAVPSGVALASDEGPLQVAGRAAEQLTFEGSLRVRWFDGEKQHSDVLTVQGANGLVVVRGGGAAMASLHRRLVEHAGGVWELLWPSDQIGSGRPPADQKYQLVNGPPVVVVDRPATVVEVRQGGALLERLALDQETGLLLRREQFEADATAASRTIEFETLRIGAPPAMPDAPRTIVNVAPKVVSSPKTAAALDGGYQRVGVYKRSGVTQVLYSDGLYDLSIFQQAGRLDRTHLPAGSTVDLSTAHGLRYAWPGGHVVVWAAHGMVYTAVSDAPLTQVLAAARSMPLASGSVSLLRRLRQVCLNLIQPLAS